MLKLCEKHINNLWQSRNCDECGRIVAAEHFKTCKVIVNGKLWIHPENRRNGT